MSLPLEIFEAIMEVMQDGKIKTPFIVYNELNRTIAHPRIAAFMVILCDQGRLKRPLRGHYQIVENVNEN